LELKKESLCDILNLINEPGILVNEKGKIFFENNAAKKFCSEIGDSKDKVSCENLAGKILNLGKESGEMEFEFFDKTIRVDFKILDIHGYTFIAFYEEEKNLESLNGKLDESYEELEALNEELTSAEEELKQQIEELNKKNKELENSEERYRALTESAMDIIFIIDCNLKVKYVNSYAAKMLKSSKENLTGKSLKQIFLFDDFKQKLNSINMVIESRIPMYFESVAMLPDEEMWLGTRLVPMFNKNGTVDSVMGIARDISQRKRIEIDNIVVNERFGKVFKHNPLAIIISRADDGQILDVNDSCENLFGYSTDELLGKKTKILYNKPKERAFFVDKLMSEGAQKNFELEIKRKCGEVRNVLLSADYLEINEERCILSIIQDVTDETIANNTREALFDISDSAFKAKDLSALYPEIHNSLRKVLNAENFYIALYNKSSNIIDFPYYNDEKDEYAPSKIFGNGMTEYILKNKKPILLTGEEIKKMAEEKTIDLIGTLPVQWMGVPLQGEDFTGVVAVQHYDDTYRYTINDRNILYFVSKQISRAIENKVKEEQLFLSEIKHRMLLDSITYPILSLREDMTIYYCNQAYAEFTGKRMADLEGRHIFEIFPEFEKTKSYNAYKECIRTGKNQEVEVEIETKNLVIRAKITRTAWGILSIAEYMSDKKKK
jgi:PAS domain S-box-containing protein